jgi:putative membrane protein
MAMLGLASLAVMPLSGQASPTPKSPTQSPPTTMRKPATGAQAGKSAPADMKFVQEAAAGGMAEVELGKLAADKATNPDVKAFGQRMVDDHSKANDELKALASQKGFTLPSGPEPAHKTMLDHLSRLTGAAFDKAYMQEMVKDHDKDVAAFKRASTSATDADLKAWAAKTLPTLQDHQTQATSINAKLASSSKPANPTK